jgi:precorrin-6A synthase
MRKLLLIGIGSGDPEHLTVQAIRALNRVDVFFALDKGSGPRDLIRLRQEICERYIERKAYRFVEAPDVARDRGADDYEQAVSDWSDRRADLYERLMRDELGEDDAGGILVWGDPSLYDGSLRVVQQIVERGSLPLEYEVIPGISSVQVLAARHRTTLNRIGRPVQITTGRLLSEGFPTESDDVVVMLDGKAAFQDVPADGVDIFWGAYLGTDDEVLIAGPLSDVAARIVATRAEARASKGWIMDTYLLRRRRPANNEKPE